ncbi:MAG: tetraacyldisaccharide 4'-kinase [Burkholderiales bacterium]|nr:tetraacyldisaccharide 4'-kinase [Burkholderiales bacterium]
MLPATRGTGRSPSRWSSRRGSGPRRDRGSGPTGVPAPRRPRPDDGVRAARSAQTPQAASPRSESVGNFPGFWRRRGPAALALYPLSLIYGALAGVRRELYRRGALPSVRVEVPVIVVGNVLVGGTGKTPLVLALTERLKGEGMRPGIVSRGHGGRGRGVAAVNDASDPAVAGDEPVLLALRAGSPVYVGRDRAAAARALLAAHPECDLVICDDGLQHYRLARDLEIAVEDERGAGNGLLLPAGPLREPAGRPVDCRVLNAPEGPAPASPAAHGVAGGAEVFRMTLEPAGIYRLDRPADILDPASLCGLRLHAVAGIGNPRRFFDTLERLGLRAEPHAFPDHHAYRAADLAFRDCDAVVMTEKDAVKCARFGCAGLYALRVEARLDAAFFEKVASRLRQVR